MVDAVHPEVVHVAAREIEPEDCAWIRSRIAPLKLLRAIAVRPGESLAEAEAHQECIDYLMLDSGAKGWPFLERAVRRNDWSVSRTIVASSRVPIILTGGLSADNVAQAISVVGPWGVDSFIHTDLPGLRREKDPAQVRTFVAAALRGFAAMIDSPPRERTIGVARRAWFFAAPDYDFLTLQPASERATNRPAPSPLPLPNLHPT